MDDAGVLFIGVPLALGFLALWSWRPLAAVVGLGLFVTAVIAGTAYLRRGTAGVSWSRAVPGAAALLVLAACLLAVLAAVETAALDALTWPFRWLLNEVQ